MNNIYLFNKNEFRYIIAFYCYMALIIFIKPPLFIDILLLSILYILHISLEKSAILLYPFLLYPFMFIMKSPGDGNSILGFFPDVFTIISILYVFLIKGKSNNKYLKLKLLIFIHAILTFIISYLHVLNISYTFIIFRQFVLPLLYLLALIKYITNSYNFSNKAFLVTKISFSIVAIIAIFNLVGLVNFNSPLPELKPVLTILGEEESKISERESIFLVAIPRLNLLTGGALGSSAAIFMTLSIIIFIRTKNIFKKIIYSIPLLVSALLTASFSLTTPIFITFIVYFFFRFGFLKKLSFSIIFIILVLILYVEFEFDPFKYFSDSILAVVIEFFQQLDLKSILFGIGPRITSEGFNFISKDKMFVIDVGMFRVFVETGIFNFILFAYIIFYGLKKGIIKLNNNFDLKIVNYFIIFLTMCLLVHANFSILPPFYPLFALCYCALVIDKEKIILEISH